MAIGSRCIFVTNNFLNLYESNFCYTSKNLKKQKIWNYEPVYAITV